MNIAPFQDMPADDVEAFQDFQLSHNMAHQKIYDTLLSQGKVIGRNPLADSNFWERDWLLSHQQEHSAIYVAINLTGLPDMASSNLKNQDELETWMEVHNQVHKNINTALGIT